METQPAQTSRSIIFGIAGLAIGLVIGLVVLGWWLFPVEWVDFSPEQMGAEDQEEYLRMAIDSLSLQYDTAAALSRYQDLGEDGPVILATIQANPAPQSETAVQAFSALVEVQPETAVQAGRSTLQVILIVFLILVVLALVGYIIYVLVRRLSGPTEAGVTPSEFPPELSRPEEAIDMEAGITEEEAGVLMAESEMEEPGIPETEIEVTEFEDQGDTTLESETDRLSPLTAEAGVLAAAAVVGAVSTEETEETPEEFGEAGAELEAQVEERLDEEGGIGAPAAGAALLAATELASETETAEADETSLGLVTEAEPELAPEETVSPDAATKMPAALEYIEGIGPAYAHKLKEIGVNTPQQLLQWGATPRGRQAIAERSEISGKLILKWVNQIDLYRIKGIGSEYAELLEQAGVDTVVELATRNPAHLYQTLVAVNEAKKLVRKLPVLPQVEDWVMQAKNLPRVVMY